MILRQILNVSRRHSRIVSSIPARNVFSATTNTNPDSCERLKFSHVNRSLIQLDGQECRDFLQGLITNDVRHLVGDGETGVSRNCIYSFMLNSSGKILADCFVYSLPGQSDLLFLDVDTNLSSKIVALLKRYKIRRKVNINLNPNYEVHTIFPEKAEEVSNDQFQHVTDDIVLVQDPRHHSFGYRMISKKGPGSEQLEGDHLQKLFDDKCSLVKRSLNRGSIDDYELFRYRTGFGEGSKDFVPETIFPFEANAELLNAVSFHKGCYIGQELTARTYHTGVIRKRLLPITLQIAYDQGLDLFPVQNIINSDNKVLGRFRANHGNVGLAVLRFAGLFTAENGHTSEPLTLANAPVQIRAHRPFWWPESLIT